MPSNPASPTLHLAIAAALAALVMVVAYYALAHTRPAAADAFFNPRTLLIGGPGPAPPGPAFADRSFRGTVGYSVSPVPAIEEPLDAAVACGPPRAPLGPGAHFPTLVPPPVNPPSTLVHSRQN